MDTDPFVHEYTLSCTPEHAFATFTERIGEWWHPDYSPDPQGLEDTAIEPRVGGAVTFRVREMGEVPWGKVTAWEPGRRLSFASTLAQSREHPSEITAVFEPSGDGCRMWFSHSGWTESNAADRHKFTEWPLILDRFKKAAEG
jgi:hypothetical protein